jgi:hypothetical protein
MPYRLAWWRKSCQVDSATAGRRRSLGAPKAWLAAYCRRITQDGTLCANLMLSIAKGIPQQMVMRRPSKDPDDPRPIEVHFVATPTLQERMHAAEWLAERGYGRAVEIVDITDKQAFKIIHLARPTATR